jgi:glycosyltransferase involved in cell wall biosynthesis
VNSTNKIVGSSREDGTKPTVAIVTSSVSRNAGGLFDAVRGLVKQLPDAGVAPHVFGLEDAFTERDRSAWSPIPLSTGKSFGPPSVGFSPTLRRSLMDADAALVHTHGIWMHPSADVVAWRKEFRKPYLISPHGMLDRWILNRSRAKKWLALAAYERAHLGGAACFHALSLEEAQGIRAAGFSQPIAIIPNGVDLPEPVERPKPSWWDDTLEGKRLLLYFGRLHPKKGLDNLLLAWKMVQARSLNKRLVLVIGGWGDKAYIDQLDQIVEGRAADYGVRFVGPQFGEAKQQTYAACDGLVLPSFSEGLPMVPLEAWSHGLPCALTDQCNLPEAFVAGAAFRIGADVESLKRFLVEFDDAEEQNLRAIGERGRALVARCFVWSYVAQRMAAVYRWLLGNGDRPEFVVDHVA